MDLSEMVGRSVVFGVATYRIEAVRQCTDRESSNLYAVAVSAPTGPDGDREQVTVPMISAPGDRRPVILHPWDWQSVPDPFTIEDVAAIQWCELGSSAPAVMLDGWPYAAPFGERSGSYGR